MFYDIIIRTKKPANGSNISRINLFLFSVFKVDFHVWQFMGPRLRSVSLGGNLWGCQCEFVEKLAAFIKTNPGLQVQDPQDIQCFNETLRSNSSLTTSNCADVLAVSFRTGKKYVP